MPRPRTPGLDAYYTSPAAAAACVRQMRAWLAERGIGPDQCRVFEPSAGAGAFMDAWGEGVIGWDLAPGRADIRQADFLMDKPVDRFMPLRDTRHPWRLALGNPPFGRKAATAIAFLNAALDHADAVGFVMPVQMRKWSGQRRVRATAALWQDKALPEASFLFDGKPYAVRCAFQIWTPTRDPFGQSATDNLRHRHPPRARHPDFEAWQYNRTPEAERYFDYEWDFAVVRQGYQDYSVLHEKSETLDRRQQWIFFKASSPVVLERLRRIDFTMLSRRNTGLPGFGKADVVDAYESLLQERAP